MQEISNPKPKIYPTEPLLVERDAMKNRVITGAIAALLLVKAIHVIGRMDQNIFIGNIPDLLTIIPFGVVPTIMSDILKIPETAGTQMLDRVLYLGEAFILGVFVLRQMVISLYKLPKIVK